MSVEITPKIMTARVAAYKDAIELARTQGLTWNEIASMIGIDNGIKLRRAFVRALAGIESGRLAPRQISLTPMVRSEIPDKSRAITGAGIGEMSGFVKKRVPFPPFDDDKD
jgi:hypothetical protein